MEKFALLARVTAKPGKENEVAEFFKKRFAFSRSRSRYCKMVWLKN